MKTTSIPESYVDVVGLYIKELRTQKKITQAELGRIINVSQGTVARIEKGHITISVVTIRKLARFFVIPIAELIAEIDRRADEIGVPDELPRI